MPEREPNDDRHEDRYPSVAFDARRFRPRRTNRLAALITLAALVVVIVLVALLA